MSLLILALIFVSCDSLSIGVSKQVKRDIDGNFNPDWVQLKNKQDNELREFVGVKSKPKKRLAMPVNFILRAVAEPEGDDYYDKMLGESDNEDYFEKKEWSDIHRFVHPVDANTPLNAKNLSDIEGIVNILTKPVNHPLTKVSKSQSRKNKNKKDKLKRENDDFFDDSTSEHEVEEIKKYEVPIKKNKLHKYEDDVEYEDGVSEKPKPIIDTTKEDERRENEAKKAKILESVDELKERHAAEQRTISENAKEEEIHKEQMERDRIKTQSERKNVDKYAHIDSKWKKALQDYNDEYEDQESEMKDKYKMYHFKSSTTTTTLTPKTKPKKNKSVATGKLSVFRNPHLYMVSDEEDDVTTTSTTSTTQKSTKLTPKPKIYSSRYSKAPEDNVRISLVPEGDSKEGEPTLFFPKVKNRPKFRIKTTKSPNFDLSKEKSILTTGSDPTGPNLSYTTRNPTSEDADSSASHTLASKTLSLAPSVSNTTPNTTLDLDLKSAPSDEKPKKKEIKEGNYDIKTGKGKEYSSEHDEVHEEHGKKAYEGVHKEVKSDKGHHDKEDHLDKYDDQGGVDQRHHDENKHYGLHHHEEHGKKHAKYEESGKHSKGHSTKGSHDIHKKDEYEKKVEFFEEEGDSFDDEGDGGHHRERDHSSGHHFKKGYKKAGHAGYSKGETGHFGKGAHGYHLKGHHGSAGHASHGRHEAAHHKGDGGAGGRKWIYHHGHPAKTANLVVIDRRTDAYQHGPQYYG